MIKKIRIQNYKCFRDTTFSLYEKKDDYQYYNVFIGKNDVGKSVLLESINSFKSSFKSNESEEKSKMTFIIEADDTLKQELDCLFKTNKSIIEKAGILKQIPNSFLRTFFELSVQDIEEIHLSAAEGTKDSDSSLSSYVVFKFKNSEINLEKEIWEEIKKLRRGSEETIELYKCGNSAEKTNKNINDPNINFTFEKSFILSDKGDIGFTKCEKNKKNQFNLLRFLLWQFRWLRKTIWDKSFVIDKNEKTELVSNIFGKKVSVYQKEDLFERNEIDIFTCFLKEEEKNKIKEFFRKDDWLSIETDNNWIVKKLQENFRHLIDTNFKGLEKLNMFFEIRDNFLQISIRETAQEEIWEEEQMYVDLIQKLSKQKNEIEKIVDSTELIKKHSNNLKNKLKANRLNILDILDLKGYPDNLNFCIKTFPKHLKLIEDIISKSSLALYTRVKDRSPGFMSILLIWIIDWQVNNDKKKQKSMNSLAEKTPGKVMKNNNWCVIVTYKNYRSLLQKCWENFYLEDEQIKEIETKSNNNLNSICQKIAFSFLLVDEPENHLHPERQDDFFKKITSMADKYQLQTLICTHSHHFIDELLYQYNTQIVCREPNAENNNAIETKIFSFRGFQEKQNSTNLSFLQPIWTALGYKPKFDFPEKDKKYLLVEGRKDVVLIESIYKAKENKELRSLQINANPKNAIIGACILFNLDFLILLDKDKDGDCWKKEIKDSYGNWISVKRIRQLDWVDSSKTEMEDFISKKDETSFFHNPDDAKNKGKFDIKRIINLTQKNEDWLNTEITPKTKKNLEKIYEKTWSFFQEKKD